MSCFGANRAAECQDRFSHVTTQGNLELPSERELEHPRCLIVLIACEPCTLLLLIVKGRSFAALAERAMALSDTTWHAKLS